MNDKFLNNTGLQYYHNRIKTQFASQDDLDALDTKVDEIIAEGGEPNVIETVKVNGTALTPVNKAVDVEVPTATSDLTNDGDGQSPFATQDYVSQNGGKIQKIKVNNVEQTIDTSDKSVNITVPKTVTLDIQETYTYSEIKEFFDNNYIINLKVSDNSIVSGLAFLSPSTISQKYLFIDYVEDDSIKIRKYDFTNNVWTLDYYNLPTNMSDLTNDTGFITNTVNNLTNYYKKTETYSQAEVDSMISAAKTGRFVPVQTLPTENIDTTVIYLVPKTDAETKDVKDEYINLDGTTAGWELIGSTRIDLSNYWNSTNLVAITTSEIDTIVAGS